MKPERIRNQGLGKVALVGIVVAIIFGIIVAVGAVLGSTSSKTTLTRASSSTSSIEITSSNTVGLSTISNALISVTTISSSSSTSQTTIRSSSTTFNVVQAASTLKKQIANLGGVGLPQLTSLNYLQSNNTLVVEYTTWNVGSGEAAVFSEQLQIMNIIVSYLSSFNLNASIQVHVLSVDQNVAKSYYVPLKWDEAVMMSNLVYSYSWWLKKIADPTYSAPIASTQGITPGIRFMTLKTSIEKLGGTGLPLVTMMSYDNSSNQFLIEYSTWQMGESSIFSEQQQIANISVIYFNGIKITPNIEFRTLPPILPFGDNSTFDTKLLWQNLIQLSTLQYSYTAWSAVTTQSTLAESSSTSSSTTTMVTTSSCALWSYPPILNGTESLTNSTLLEQGGGYLGFNLKPGNSVYYGFTPNENVTITGVIQSDSAVPVTIEIWGNNGSTWSTKYFSQTATEVSINNVAIPAAAASTNHVSYALFIEDAQNQNLNVTIIQSLIVHYPGC